MIVIVRKVVEPHPGLHIGNEINSTLTTDELKVSDVLQATSFTDNQH